jgi:hypothetical protein
MVSFRQAEAQSMKALQDRREQTRQDFFKGRQDVSPNRLDRRQIQADLYEQFKSDPTKTKLVSGTTNLYQAAQPGGITLADKAQELAFKYGPTLKEIGGDIRYGIGSIMQGLAEKGTPLMQLGKAGIEGLQKFFAPKPKATYGGTSSITTTETTPSFDLEAKMSAYEDPIKFYASSSKQKYPGYSDQQSEYYYEDKPKESPTGDQYLYADAGDAAQNYMNLLKNVQNLGNTPYGKFGMKDVLSSPTFTYEKEIGPGTLSGTIGDNKASLGYSMIFNKGGRVRGTGIMGALR